MNFANGEKNSAEESAADGAGAGGRAGGRRWWRWWPALVAPATPQSANLRCEHAAFLARMGSEKNFKGDLTQPEGDGDQLMARCCLGSHSARLMIKLEGAIWRIGLPLQVLGLV